MEKANGDLVPTFGNPLAAAVFAVALTSPGVRIDGLRDAALSWHIPPPVTVMRGLRLLMDAGVKAPAAAKGARELLPPNPRLGQSDALLLGTHVLRAARERGLPPPFLAATLLQESA